VAGVANAIDLAAGGSHTCAVQADGAVLCWGGGENGQLGDGSRSDRATVVRVTSLPPALRVAAGDRHTCALLRDKSIRCWGSNMFGESGAAAHDDYGTYTGPLKVGGDSPGPSAVEGISTAQSIALGGGQSCALMDSGVVKCWGGDAFHPRAQEVKGLRPAASIQGAGRHMCALLRSGGIACWGTNEHGQLGDGTRKNHQKPADVHGVQQGLMLAVGRERSNRTGPCCVGDRTCPASWETEPGSRGSCRPG
jgi:alpha-tubulin suppressor-like RCC1 family protein